MVLLVLIVEYLALKIKNKALKISINGAEMSMWKGT